MLCTERREAPGEVRSQPLRGRKRAWQGGGQAMKGFVAGVGQQAGVFPGRIERLGGCCGHVGLRPHGGVPGGQVTGPQSGRVWLNGAGS